MAEKEESRVKELVARLRSGKVAAYEAILREAADALEAAEWERNDIVGVGPGISEPDKFANCSDCGRRMVWNRAAKDQGPGSSWMCPRCVLERCLKAERERDEWKAKAEAAVIAYAKYDAELRAVVEQAKAIQGSPGSILASTITPEQRAAIEYLLKPRQWGGEFWTLIDALRASEQPKPRYELRPTGGPSAIWDNEHVAFVSDLEAIAALNAAEPRIARQQSVRLADDARGTGLTEDR